MDVKTWTDRTKLAFLRLLRGDFQREHATEIERTALSAAKPPVSNPIAQDYAAWRRSLLWIAGVSITFQALLQAVTFTALAEHLDPQTVQALGAENLDTIDGVFAFLIVPVFVGGVLSLLAAWRWTKVRVSRRLARIGFLIMFLTPFVMAALPVKEMLDYERVPEQARDSLAMGVGAIVGLQISLLIGSRAVALFPGIIRSSMALKTLVPQSPMPGWASTLLAPLYAIFFLVAFALINQIQGNILLVLSVACFVLTPMVYVWRGRTLLSPLAPGEVSAKLQRVKRPALVLQALGVLFLLIFFVDVGMPFVDMLIFLVSVLGSVVLLTVVGADFLLALLRHGHEQSRALVESDMQKDLEARFHDLEEVGFTDLSTGEDEAD